MNKTDERFYQYYYLQRLEFVVLQPNYNGLVQLSINYSGPTKAKRPDQPVFSISNGLLHLQAQHYQQIQSIYIQLTYTVHLHSNTDVDLLGKQ